MKAIQLGRYASPDNIRLIEKPKPTPKANEVLIGVRATCINDWDANILLGRPRIMRLFQGFFSPWTKTPGCDVAGVVEAVGSNVTRWHVGDEVYGDLHNCDFGAFAEYVCADENALTTKPANLDFEQAAALPHTATLAWQSFTDTIQLQKGQSLLINGAGGGVGTIAIQLAKLKGVNEITAVDSAEKLPMLKAIGCTQTIDYRQQDFTELNQTFDVILDVKMLHHPKCYTKVLNPGGVYITVGGSLYRTLQLLLLGGTIAKSHNKQVCLMGLEANRGLAQMAPLFEANQIQPVIDQIFDLEQTAQAMSHYLSGKSKGKVVIHV